MKHQIVPTSIINLLITFYSYSIEIIIIAHNDKLEGEKPRIICISELDTNKNCQFEVHLLNDSIRSGISYRSNANCGICYIQGFDLPQRIVSLNDAINKNYSYDVIFIAQHENAQCNAYIIDKNTEEPDF